MHHFVTCDGCGMCPLVGKRHKHKTRENYDLCHACYIKECTKRDLACLDYYNPVTMRDYYAAYDPTKSPAEQQQYTSPEHGEGGDQQASKAAAADGEPRLELDEMLEWLVPDAEDCVVYNVLFFFVERKMEDRDKRKRQKELAELPKQPRKLRRRDR